MCVPKRVPCLSLLCLVSLTFGIKLNTDGIVLHAFRIFVHLCQSV